ncbi:hypothetical protein WJX84_006863 [Apatococcus fuscideae]|uniref:1-alkyl-2-acetylglycerophosphocholine esterase n=1 Tax=Apatococcus fuscideae TaxID=2026836 RepID=A0AAW1RXU6_9CHLO
MPVVDSLLGLQMLPQPAWQPAIPSTLCHVSADAPFQACALLYRTSSVQTLEGGGEERLRRAYQRSAWAVPSMRFSSAWPEAMRLRGLSFHGVFSCFRAPSSAELAIPDWVDKKTSAEKHLSGRLFYPADAVAPGLCGLGSSPHVAWLPCWGYARGFGQFLFGWRKGLKNQVFRNMFEVLAFTMGSWVKIEAAQDAALVGTDFKLPVVVFSHGIGGFRNAYSTILTELASWGFVVMAMEHADGTASAVRLSNGKFRSYGGWPPTEEGRLDQTRYRAQECQKAVDLLKGIATGAPAAGLKMGTKAKSPLASFLGRLDMECCAIMGHSFGGATAGLLAAQEAAFHCAICLDPWWPALLPECPTLVAWQTTTPILIMGSQDWNSQEKPQGFYAAGAERQQAILKAAKRARQQASAPMELGPSGRSGSEEVGTHLGGGALLLVLAGSSHHSFHDVLALFTTYFKGILKKVGFQSVLEPFQGLRLIRRCMLTFLAQHLPLTPDQQSLLAPFPHPTDPPPKPARLNTPEGATKTTAASPSSPTATEHGQRGAPGIAVMAASEGVAAAGQHRARKRLAATGVSDADKPLFEQLVGGPDAIFMLETSS